MKRHYRILILGGGNAGISVAARLLNTDSTLEIGLLDPSDRHYYQPAWTLVGGGAFDIHDTVRREEDVMPRGVTWIREAAASLDPDSNTVTTSTGRSYTYDWLVVAAGIQLDWDAVKGLREALGHDGVTSNYSFQTAPYTFELIRGLRNGRAIFHNPHTPVKCAGAPHKIMYLAADHWRRQGLLKDISIDYWSGAPRLFSVTKYENTLLEVVKRSNIGLHFDQRLEEIDGPNKRARFTAMGGEQTGRDTWVDYDIIHVTPPQSAPDFIKRSPLANAAGWAEVDRHTLQHVRHANVFSLGDCASLPTSKTGAAIRKQAPVLVRNLLAAMAGKPLDGRYDGYTSCPLVTGYGKLVLAEFDYDLQPQETFPFDQSRERWSMYQLKKRILPWLYWNRILTGKS